MEITIGTRIVLDFTNDEHTTLKPGDKGTVAHIDDAGTVHTNWDQGSRLGLIPGVDKFHAIEEAAA